MSVFLEAFCHVQAFYLIHTQLHRFQVYGNFILMADLNWNLNSCKYNKYFTASFANLEYSSSSKLD